MTCILANTRTDIQFPASGWEPDFLATRKEEDFLKKGQTIYLARNHIKIFEVNNQKVNVKKFCIPPLPNRILYSLGLRTPKAKTSALHAQEILRRGFLTPAPYGYTIKRRFGLINFSYLITEQVAGTMLGYKDHPEHLIREVARYAARLHEHGMLHRDFTPNNILYTEKDGKYEFILVDINRFIFSDKPFPAWACIRSLTQPFYQDAQIRIFVDEYAKARGINPGIVRWVLAWRHWSNGYHAFKLSLKKIPVIRSLVPKRLDKQEKSNKA